MSDVPGITSGPECLADIAPLPEVAAIDRSSFEADWLARQQPVVLRGLVRHWPAVQQALAGPEVLCRLLLAWDSGAAVDAVLVPPGLRGRVFYADHEGDWGRFNFLRRQLPLAQVVEQLVRYSHFDSPPSVAVQSALLARCAPGFGATHALPLLDADVAPRLWLGNALITPAHFDESHNIACVVAGQRRFTLFAPQAIGLLYPGPPLHAPTGTPISLADLTQPDFQRFPRLRQAFAAGFTALLGPGDALYIPPLWWHHVQSFAPLNMLVNYWWRAPDDGPALDLLLSAWRTLGRQHPAQRQAWAALLGHYLLDPAAEPQAHWPDGLRAAWAQALADQAAPPTT